MRQASNQAFLDRCRQRWARQPKSLDQLCRQIDAEYQIPRPAAAQHLPAFQAATHLLGVCGEAALLVFCGFLSAFLFVKASHWFAISIWVEIAAHCLGIAAVLIAFIIDRDGRVAFYVMWTHAPTLYKAIEQLMRQDGHGVVNGGVDRTPHILPAMTDGWNGLRRGLPQSLIDMETATPTTGVSAWLGHQLRPLLAPLTLRAEPLPPAAKAGLALGAVALVVLGAQAFRRDSRRDDWMRYLGRLWG